MSTDAKPTLQGVPEGLEIVRWGVPNKGEHYISQNGLEYCSSDDHDEGYCLIVRAVEGYSIQFHVALQRLVPEECLPRPSKLVATFDIRTRLQQERITKYLNQFPELNKIENLP